MLLAVDGTEPVWSRGESVVTLRSHDSLSKLALLLMAMSALHVALYVLLGDPLGDPDKDPGAVADNSCCFSSATAEADGRRDGGGVGCARREAC